MKALVFSFKSIKKFIIILCIAIMIIVPLLLIWQGLDFTDIGYSLTCYQQIFNDPSCIAYCLPNWMQYIIGGLWMKIFNSLGLMGINLGGVAITWLTVFFTYIILNKYIEKTILIWGVTIATIYSLGYINIIHYDNLSALFFIITIFFIMRYIETQKSIYIFSAGVAECLNTLIRLPNILGFIFIFAVIIFNYNNNKRLKKQALDIGLFCIGFFITLLLSLFIMKQMNYLYIFINGIHDLFKISSIKGNNHNGGILSSIFFSSNVNSIGYTSLTIIIIMILSIVLDKIKNKILYFTAYILILYVFYFSINFYIISFIVGLSYFICSLYALNIIKSNFNFRLINFLGFLLILISPIGTTIGQSITVYTSWITIPIIFYFIYNLIKNNNVIYLKIININRKRLFILSNKALKSFSILFIILVTFYVIKNVCLFTYRDSSNRLMMTYNINNKYLKYTYTTKDRASTVNELLAELTKYVHKNDYLWAEGAMSTVYYATETKPFIFNPWDLSMEIPLNDAIKKAESKNLPPPIIVKQNVNTGDPNWPQYYCKWTDHCGINQNHNKIVNEFIEKYHYKLVWENTYFKIYVTDEKKLK